MLLSFRSATASRFGRKNHFIYSAKLVNRSVAKSNLVTEKWVRWGSGNCSIFMFKSISNCLLETTCLHDRVCRSVRIASSPDRRRKEGSGCPKIPSRGRVRSLCLTKCFTSFVSYVRSTTWFLAIALVFQTIASIHWPGTCIRLDNVKANYSYSLFFFRSGKCINENITGAFQQQQNI